MQHAWHAYERDAWGDDDCELVPLAPHPGLLTIFSLDHPISRKGSNLTSAGACGYTIVDTLDTLLLMGLDDEYGRARDWVAKSLNFDLDAEFNTFETTIRLLGGLLSAYHLSDGDDLYLELATDLADRILPAFNTPTGM